MKTVYAQQNDNLDLLIYRHFGTTDGIVEIVAELNPLLLQSAVLDIGTPVVLPEFDNLTQATDSRILQLWD